MVGGRTVNALPENPYSTVSELLVQFLRRRHLSQAHRDAFFASNNLLVPADRFRELEGFDTGFSLAAGEDRDFCLRWTKRGWPSTYTSDAVLHHAHPLTLTGFLRQHYTYGRGAFHIHRKHTAGQHSTGRPLSFYRDLMTHPLRQHSTLRGGGYALLMALAQAATVAGYGTEAVAIHLSHPL
jgi:GT2 family glycosyltransferase